MDRESVKAIELNGIVHNATKIGVQDGDCEDLVNLRFKDGSWRASGDGKHVFSMQYQSDVPNTNGVAYTQLYIHTNVYRHILGVRNNTLYWFGNIDADGVFEALDVPAELTSVSGDLYICQTGHLLTIIDDTGGFDYLLFKPADTLYKKCYVDENGSQTDRGVFPFGQIHFNWADAGEAGTITEDKTGKDGWRKWGGKSSDWNGEYPWFGGAKFKEISGGGKESLHNEMVAIYGKAKEKNYFTDPFLVCAAIKLYDGKYMYASAPALIYPRQRAYNFSSRYTYPQEKNPNHQSTDGDSLEIIGTDAAYSCNAIIGRPKAVGTEYRIENYAETRICADLTSESGTKGNYGNENNARKADENTLGVFRNGVCTAKLDGNIKAYEAWKFQIRGVNLCVHFDSDLLQTMRENKDVFQSLCIFVTTQSPIYNMEKCSDVVRMAFNDTIVSLTHVRAANASYLPTRRKDSEIRYDLLNSPFYLLREYTQDELQNLLANPVVDLQDVKYKGLLENITQQNTLSVEASSRYSYIPKAQYNYNGRLHIANYTQTQFHGYPLDTFHLNNHSLRYKSGEQFMETLDNVIGYYDDTLSEPRAKYSLVNNGYVTTKGTVSAYVETEIETSEGIQKVCRYIPLGGNKTLPSGDFIEQPGALIT